MVGGWGILFGESSTPDRGFPLILPDSVISYSGGPEYERVAFFRYDKGGKVKKIKECFNVLQCDGGQKKRKKEKEAFIFTLNTLFGFKHWICGFRTISWGCKTGCPSPILG